MALTAMSPVAMAEGGASFAGKTITMLIGYAAGGGTDASGRMIAQFLTKYMPGNPTVVVQNVPGADGLIALNYFVQQAKPDGLTVTMGSGTAVDPGHFRKPEAKYDPTKFIYVGGVGRGGTLMVIRKQSLQRLQAKSSTPVIMGALAGVPRSGMLMTAWGIEYLGWNAKWVLGYRGTKDLMIALERGEIDMTSTANVTEIQTLLDRGDVIMLAQSGTIEDGKWVARSDLPKNVPTIQALLQDRIDQPLAKAAFEYWKALNAVDKWLALPPGVPADIVAAYRQAYMQAMGDPEFFEHGRRISQDFSVQSVADVESIIKTLATTPDDAVNYMSVILKKQGLEF
jgi:tripartite-type tricarboxylate transporter receptor subunit TctC